MNLFARLESISRVYGNGYAEHRALNAVSFDVHEGDLVAVTGPSGSGKSTLLNILGLLDRPSEGTQFFLGHDLSSCSPKQIAALRREHIGFVLQFFALIDSYTVRRNIELPLRYRGIGRAERNRRVTRAAESLGITDTLEAFPYELSIGQVQRAAVARAAAARPALLLADEPTGSLDSENGRRVLEILKELNKNGSTVVMVTHDESLAAEFPRRIRLKDGTRVAEPVD